MAKKKKTEKPARQLTKRQLSHYQRQRRRQRIVFIGGIAVIAVIILIVLVGWFMGEYVPLKETVIEIDTVEYDLGYYIDALKYYTYMYYGENAKPEDVPNLTNSVTNLIQESSLIIWGAATLGISVSDDEVRESLNNLDIKVNNASTDMTKAQILAGRVKESYFAEQLPASDNQVNIMVMLLESENQAAELRDRLQGSDNFSALAEEFSLHSSQANKGEIGWHPKDVLVDLLSSFVPGNYAFSAKAGDLSEPLYDKQKSKQVGYWLINVLEIPSEMSAQVQGILLGSEQEAREIKAELKVTDNLTGLIEEYSQHQDSKERGGHLGLVNKNTMSEAVDGYVFSDNVEIGVWSEPLRDETVITIGGYWLVKVLDKDDDKEITEEDREYLLNQAYNDWFNALRMQKIAFISIAALTPEKIQWAVEKVQESLQ